MNMKSFRDYINLIESMAHTMPGRRFIPPKTPSEVMAWAIRTKPPEWQSFLAFAHWMKEHGMSGYDLPKALELASHYDHVEEKDDWLLPGDTVESARRVFAAYENIFDAWEQDQ